MAISDRSIRNPLVVKLSQFAALSDEDVGLLEALCLPEERMLNSTPPEILRYIDGLERNRAGGADFQDV